MPRLPPGPATPIIVEQPVSGIEIELIGGRRVRFDRDIDAEMMLTGRIGARGRRSMMLIPGIVKLTRSSQPSRTLFLERGQPCRRAKDFSAPNRRATDGRRIAPLLKLTMPSGALITKPTTVHEAGAGSTFRRPLVPKDWCLVRGRYGHAADD